MIIGMVMASGMVWAQLPVLHCGDSGYLYGRECASYNIRYGQTYMTPRGGFKGTVIQSEQDTMVYGVVVPCNYLSYNPYLWVYILKEELVGYDTSIDNQPLFTFWPVRSALYCFIGHPPVSFSEMEFVSRGEYTNVEYSPAYEFFFDEPYYLPAGERIYVGVCESPCNVWHYSVATKELVNSPLPAPLFCVMGQVWPLIPAPMDSAWSIMLLNFMTEVDTSSYPGVYKTFGFLPIVHPPIGEELNPRHEHPIVPEGVHGLRMEGMDMGMPMVGWDSVIGPEWGPLGVNVDMYQVNYAEYGRVYDTADVVETVNTWCTLPGTFDTMKYYKMRCRALSRHVCDIHDTVVWGPWGEEAYFYTGTRYPDTLPLECGEVEGFHCNGESGEMPYFEWVRGRGQTLFEVAYAPDRAAWETEVVQGTSWRMPETVRPGVEYKVRVRAKCVHRCYIHDTVMWGPWSSVERVTTPLREGLQEAKSDGTELFSLMPNPARGRVTVRPELSSGQCPAVLTVTDAQGREVQRRTLEDGTPVTLELGAVASGTYLVTLKCRDGAGGTRRLQVE